MPAQIGDYVTGRLVGVNDCRQGVYIGDRLGKKLIAGMLHTYEVEPYVTVVPDERLFGEAMEHTKRVRLHLATKAD